MYIFWIFVIPKLLCVLTYWYVLCSIQQYPEIYYYHNKIITRKFLRVLYFAEGKSEEEFLWFTYFH